MLFDSHVPEKNVSPSIFNLKRTKFQNAKQNLGGWLWSKSARAEEATMTVLHSIQSILPNIRPW
jgi:hypothetical protein